MVPSTAMAVMADTEEAMEVMEVMEGMDLVVAMAATEEMQVLEDKRAKVVKEDPMAVKMARTALIISFSSKKTEANTASVIKIPVNRGFQLLLRY